MKKIHFPQFVILLTFIFAAFLVSCSKERAALPPTASEATENVSTERIANWGSITGMIWPAKTDVKISVDNAYYSIREYYFLKDGSFRVDRIPPGIYTVTIIDFKRSNQYIIPEVKVAVGQVTNMGVIKLDIKK